MSSVESLQRFPSSEEISTQKTTPLSSVSNLLASNLSLFKSISPRHAKPPLIEGRKSMTDLKSELTQITKIFQKAKARNVYLGQDSKENRQPSLRGLKVGKELSEHQEDLSCLRS
jgi:hypothetical protein